MRILKESSKGGERLRSSNDGWGTSNLLKGG
jgi:hypothetical protein